MSDRGIGQRALERKLQAGNASLNKFFRRPGAKLSLDRLRKVADILEYRFEWLAWEHGKPKHDESPSTQIRLR